MAISASTFSGLGSAAQDLFSGNAQATGLQIQAEGTDISAQSTLLNAEALKLQAQGNTVESENYTQAQALAKLNETFTERNAEMQQAAADRAIYQGVGTAKAGAAGSGLLDSSVTDVLADSARQGSIQKQILGEQNLITEAGQNEQAQAYGNLAEYAAYGASVQLDMSGKMTQIAGEQTQIADQERQLATTTQDNSFITAGLKVAGAIAGLFIGGPAGAQAGAAVGDVVGGAVAGTG